jgi:methionine-rich copper-binding protein CopC
MKTFRPLAAAMATLGLTVAVPALAHPTLVSASPAAAATASNVRTVTLTFNETFLPQMSDIEIVMTGMPGMAGHHPAMKVAGVKVAASADRKSLVATLARPLPADTYEVNWHAVGTDTHRVSGKVSFTVR